MCVCVLGVCELAGVANDDGIGTEMLPCAFCSPSEILWPRSRIVKQIYTRRQATMVLQLHPSTTVLFKHVACTLFIKSLKGHLT